MEFYNESCWKITWICTVTLCQLLYQFFLQLKAEVAKEVANARRKQHLSSLQYYCALNALQYRKRVAMMEPMLGYTRGQVWTLKHVHWKCKTLLFWGLINGNEGSMNFHLACLDYHDWFCLWQVVECLGVQERHQLKKKSKTLACKISLRLTFYG